MLARGMSAGFIEVELYQGVHGGNDKAKSVPHAVGRAVTRSDHVYKRRNMPGSILRIIYHSRGL